MKGKLHFILTQVFIVRASAISWIRCDNIIVTNLLAEISMHQHIQIYLEEKKEGKLCIVTIRHSLQADFLVQL